MELRWPSTPYNYILLCGSALCVIFGTNPTKAIEVFAPAKVFVENGTTGILRCSFKSKEVISSAATVTWNFRPVGSDEAVAIFYFSNGKSFNAPGQFDKRVQYIGDLNRKDASIQLLQTQFIDNGTYLCDVKNPPDIACTPARTQVIVVVKESLPQSNTAVIVGAVCGAVIGVFLIAVVTCLIIKKHRTSHDYEGCAIESVSSHAVRPGKKPESSVEGSRCSSPSAPIQGPVIYAQLDHSGNKSPNSFHKVEPVVYADIRKN